MATALVQHRVNDYDAFREVYDSVAPMQAAGGVIAESVHRMVGDPDNVLVTIARSMISLSGSPSRRWPGASRMSSIVTLSDNLGAPNGDSKRSRKRLDETRARVRTSSSLLSLILLFP